MLNSVRIRIAIMGTYGFSAKCIVENVMHYDGVRLSTSTIYKVLREEGLKLWDFRNGNTTEAKRQMAVIGVRRKKMSA